MQKEKVRLLLVDDHALIRVGLKKLLALEQGIEVIGEATNGLEAVRLAEELLPEIILMDINMPVMNGIEATRLIKEKQPAVEIIALTIHDDEEYVYELISAGVSGYILKDIGVDELIKTIEKVSAGESVFHPGIARKISREFRRIMRSRESKPRLTSRETEVLECVVRGESNKEIASSLFISDKTVKNHLSNIFRKLEVDDRTQAAMYAVKNKLVKLKW